MNFRPSGFYEEAVAAARGSTTSSQSPSSSSSFHHHRTTNLFPPNYPYSPHEPPENSSSADDHSLFRRGGVANEASGSSTAPIQREHMFDKVVTPSDVGKLNRLVIPKQHAEKYFPLDSSTNEKGLLLNFEDRNGKPWRFRYSYWNSSQSYVMTKGWSRFVKEKKLDAGDIVSFQRGVGELAKDRLFIDWRRRPDFPPPPHHQFSFHRSPTVGPWSPLFMPPRDHHQHYSHFVQPSYQPHHHHPYAAYGGIVNGNPCPPGSIMYLRSAQGGGGSGGGGVLAPNQIHVGGYGGAGGQQIRGAEGQMVFDSVPVVQGKAAAKRLRLFGVNMDCPITDQDNDNDCDHVIPALMLTPPPPPEPVLFNSSSSSSSLARLRPDYGDEDEDDKGKGSMSLDLDI